MTVLYFLSLFSSICASEQGKREKTQKGESTRTHRKKHTHASSFLELVTKMESFMTACLGSIGVAIVNPLSASGWCTGKTTTKNLFFPTRNLFSPIPVLCSLFTLSLFSGDVWFIFLGCQMLRWDHFFKSLLFFVWPRPIDVGDC